MIGRGRTGSYNVKEERENNNNTPTRRPRFWVLFIAATFCVHTTQVLIWKSMGGMYTTNADELQLTIQEQDSLGGLLANRRQHHHRRLETCPDVPFEPVALQKAVDANNAFHKLGGNLKSVQRFRDEAMDDTLQRLSLTFVPDDNPQEAVPKLTTFLKKYYDNHYDPRGGYGKPLPGKFVRKGQEDKQNADLPELFGNRWIEPLEEVDGRSKWDASLGPIGPTCPNLVQLGNKARDGYKFFCPPATETANSSALKQKERRVSDSKCHVVSVGGNDNWKFEVAAADTLGCIIHTFDCTLPDNKPRHKPDRNDIRFYPHCLDGKTWKDTHGRSYVSYQDLLAKAGITEAPSYFKLDVEGFEYDIFQQMIQQDQQQQDRALSLLPQQIQVELHWATRMTGVEWMPRTRSAGELALLSGMMYLGGGYLPIHLDFNAHCTTCMEVLYYKAIC